MAAAHPAAEMDIMAAPFPPAGVGGGVGLSEGGDEMVEGGTTVPEGENEGARSELGGAGGEVVGEGKNGGGEVLGEMAGWGEIGVGTGGDSLGEGLGDADGAWEEIGERRRDMERRRRRIGKEEEIAIGREGKRTGANASSKGWKC